MNTSHSFKEKVTCIVIFDPLICSAQRHRRQHLSLLTAQAIGLRAGVSKYDGIRQTLRATPDMGLGLSPRRSPCP